MRSKVGICLQLLAQPSAGVKVIVEGNSYVEEGGSVQADLVLHIDEGEKVTTVWLSPAETRMLAWFLSNWDFRDSV